MTTPKITIAVSGPRGTGKTITAMRIVVLLRSLGFDTRYQGATKQVTRVIEELIRDDPTVFDAATEPREFLVLDTTDELADEDD